MRPYGWGCNWVKDAGYCAKFGQDRNYDACMNCPRVVGSPDEAEWLKFFEHAKRIKDDFCE